MRSRQPFFLLAFSFGCPKEKVMPPRTYKRKVHKSLTALASALAFRVSLFHEDRMRLGIAATGIETRLIASLHLFSIFAACGVFPRVRESSFF